MSFHTRILVFHSFSTMRYIILIPLLLCNKILIKSFTFTRKCGYSTGGMSHHVHRSTRQEKRKINDIVKEMGLLPVKKNEERGNKRRREGEWERKESKGNVRNDGKHYSNNSSPEVGDSYHNDPHNVMKEVDIMAQLSYSRQGHAVLRSFLPPNLLVSIKRDLQRHIVTKQTETLIAWQQKVAVASRSLHVAKQCQTIQQCRDTLLSLGVPAAELPFLQFFNTWRKLPSVEALCKSTLLANAASQLMDISTVRLYQDSLFLKRQVDGKTPWHIDARMCPFDTQHMITFWIPLQHIPSDGGTALIFVNKSHSDMALPYWNDSTEYDQRLENNRYGAKPYHHYMPMALGDITAHSGWTLHCADANNVKRNGKSLQSRATGDDNVEEEEDRYALAITYVDARAEVREDVFNSIDRFKSNSGKISSKRNGKVSMNYQDLKSVSDDEDSYSFLPWIADIKPRTQFQHELVPLVWPVTANPLIRKKREFNTDHC